VSDGRPENSRAAFEAAINLGFGIELDVQLTRDHEALVFHDYGLQRLTGESGVIRQKSAEELQQVPLLGGTDTPNSLKDILAFVNGRAPLLIEIKDQDGAMGTDIGPLEKATAAALEGYVGPVALMSFNPNSTAMMAQLCPNIPRGIVTSAYRPKSWPIPKEVCDHLRDIPDYERCEASFVSHEHLDLDRPRIAELKSQGAAVLCWTITSQNAADKALQIADNITFEQYLPA
jgi:glycerophosphoryl diester phosphodiesterase